MEQKEKEEKVLLEFEVNMTAAVLYDYMLKHTYSGLQGILATIMGGLLLANYFANGGILYLIFGILVIIYIPFSLFLSSKRQMLTVEAFKQPLRYRMMDAGIEVSQGDVVEMQKWDDMIKAISTGKSIVVYTSKVKAAIFPRADLGENTVHAIEIISTHMNPSKVKIRR